MEEQNTHPDPIASFILRFVSLLIAIIVMLAVIAGWHTFLLASPIIIQVLIVLLLLAVVGALCYVAIDKLLDIQARRNSERRKQEHHAVSMHLMQTRIHSDERGNKPSLITASGTVVNLPSGNFAAPVAQHYAPHIVHNYPKAPQHTTIEETPNVQASLPAPTVPTFAELLESGAIVPGEQKSILGYSDGQARKGAWSQLHSFFVVGISGSGKSSTVAFYIALAVMHHCRLIIIDPDMEEEQSLSQRIAPLAFAFLTPIISTPQGVQRALSLIEREMATPSAYPILVICDEFTTIMRSPLWADVAQPLATCLEDVAQRGRKRSRTAIVLGQISKASRTGGTELRASMAATFVHRLPAPMARLVIDSDTARSAPELATGEVLVQLANQVEPYRMTIPRTEIADMDTVKSLVLRRAEPIQQPFQERSTVFQERSTNPTITVLRNDVNAPTNAIERMRALYCSAPEKPSKRAIIAEVYGIRPGGSLAWKEASQAYDAMIAEIEAQKEEA